MSSGAFMELCWLNPVKPAQSKQNQKCVTCFTLRSGNHLIPPSLSLLSLLLPLPPHPSTSDLPSFFFSTLLSSSVPPVFHPALTLSDFFFPPPLQKPCLKPDIVCQAPSDSRQSGAPRLPIRPRHSTSPVRLWRLPCGNHLPPLLFVSTFLYLVLSIFYPPSFLLPLSSFHYPRLLNLFGVIIAPLAKCDTTSIFPL